MRKATILIQDNIDQTYIDLDDILYVHVQKNYTYIHRTDGSESVHLVTLKDVMDKIDAVSDYSISKFMRLGRSHIINSTYIMSKNDLALNKYNNNHRSACRLFRVNS